MTFSKKQLLKARANIRYTLPNLPDDMAAETPELFEPWIVGKKYYLGDRFQHEGKLYKCAQPEITGSADYPPGAPGTESLYTEVAKPGDGTRDNPIRYSGNMELLEGLYYTQFDVEYLCFRSTGTPVYNNLADLVGLYVEIVE